jgi:hypothetical protein
MIADGCEDGIDFWRRYAGDRTHKPSRRSKTVIPRMAQVHFTAWLRTIAPDGPREAAGATVGAALQALFAAEPHVRGYVLDEQGRLRKHVCIFADGKRLPHAAALTHAVGPNSKIYVMQALSGG